MNRSLAIRLLSILLLPAVVAACGTAGSVRVTDLPLSDEPLTGKFVWHDLMTDDVGTVRRFYHELFGWTFQDAQHPNGGDYTLITADRHFVGGIVHLDDPRGVEYSRWLGYLSVPDVNSAVESTRAAGGDAVVGPLDLGNIGRAAAIQDPQGAVVGLLRSKVGDPDDSVQTRAGHIVWNELLAADDHAAAAFYEEISGAQARAIQRRGGEYLMLRAQGRDRAGIMMRPAEDVEPFWLTHFAVADVAASARKVRQLGGEVVLAPSPDLREGTLALVTDPTGAIFALHQWTE